jgi:multicomponent Na+:H+ antiporter subunit C
MGEFLKGHYSYVLTIALICVGLYGVMFKRNLVKKAIGLSILQAAIVLFWVSIATKWDATKWSATVPVRDPSIPTEEVANYLNPLPHTLMLTAIVVGVATLGVGFALMILIYKRYEPLDEQEILSKIP